MRYAWIRIVFMDAHEDWGIRMIKKLLRLAKISIFLLLLCATIFVVSEIVERKQSRNLFGAFLEEPELYDVLFFGDSQFMNSMIPMEMWAQYGIAGYNLACYGSVLPTTYWTMINAFDYCEPKLAVIAINGINEAHKVTNHSGDLHTTMDFWPLSRNKVRMIEDLLNDPEDPDYADIEGNVYRELKSEFYLTLGKYHNRWSELTADDFAENPPHARGGELRVGLSPIMEYTLVGEDEYAEEGGHSYAYLRASIEECQRRGIEVLLVHLPAPEYVDSQKHAHTVGEIAGEYGVRFVDVTELDSIVDYAVDCFDREPHLNVSGSLKMTSFLGSYIREHYEVADRRDDARYAHWDAQLDGYRDEKRALLRAQTEINPVLMLLHDMDYDVRVAVRAHAPVYYDDLSILLMHNIARERVLSGEVYEKWSMFMYPLEAFDAALAQCVPYYLHREADHIFECCGEEAEQATRCAFGDHEDASVMIEAVDRRTGEQIEKIWY